jgi:phenylacetate-CoA ligase
MASPSEPTLSTAALYDATTLDPAIVARRTTELAQHFTWDREQILAYQQKSLRDTLRHAASASPYYREKIGALVAADAPLSAFPIMNKTILMEEFDKLVTDPRLTRQLVEQHAGTPQAGHLLLDEYRVCATGGSSGQRGVYVYDQQAWTATMAHSRRMLALMGLPPGAKGVGIGAPSPVHISNRLIAEIRAAFPDTPKLSVTTPIDEVVAALNRFRPDFISTYPSFIRKLAEEQSAGRLKIAPLAMRSIAEALSPDVRELALATWNVHVANVYGSTEAGLMAMECRHMNGMHLSEDMIIVEIVDEAYRPVPDGTTGSKALVTTLFNRTLPLFRYEFSDLLTVVEGPCPCGCPFRRIKDIEGRREEVLHAFLPDGRRVAVHAPRLWFHLVRVPGIQQYQFVQLPKGITVRIVLASGADPQGVRAAVDRIARATLADLGAPEAHMEVEIVDRIERIGTGAKQKLVAAAPPQP